MDPISIPSFFDTVTAFAALHNQELGVPAIKIILTMQQIKAGLVRGMLVHKSRPTLVYQVDDLHVYIDADYILLRNGGVFVSTLKKTGKLKLHIPISTPPYYRTIAVISLP